MIPNITAEQNANLKTLADYLSNMTPPPEFGMAVYMRDVNDQHLEPEQHECGAVACAVGHGPKAGMWPFPGESWSEYSYRVFGLDSDDWVWCFAGDWASIDNTPKGAAARINWLLEHGKAPEDWMKQLCGKVPLCYL